MTRSWWLDVEWHAVVDDTIGGWSIATRNEPTSKIDNRLEGPDRILGSFLNEATAHYIAEMHNRTLVGPRKTRQFDPCPVCAQPARLCTRCRQFVEGVDATEVGASGTLCEVCQTPGIYTTVDIDGPLLCSECAAYMAAQGLEIMFDPRYHGEEMGG